MDDEYDFAELDNRDVDSDVPLRPKTVKEWQAEQAERFSPWMRKKLEDQGQWPQVKYDYCEEHAIAYKLGGSGCRSCHNREMDLKWRARDEVDPHISDKQFYERWGTPRRKGRWNVAQPPEGWWYCGKHKRWFANQSICKQCKQESRYGGRRWEPEVQLYCNTHDLYYSREQYGEHCPECKAKPKQTIYEEEINPTLAAYGSQEHFLKYTEADVQATMGLVASRPYEHQVYDTQVLAAILKETEEILGTKTDLQTGVEFEVESKRQLAALDDTLERLLEKKAELLRREEIKKKLGEEDTHEDDTVIFFRKRFPGSEQKYTFVALKIAGGWYLSGAASRKLSWEDFTDFLAKNGSEFWLATEWSALIEGFEQPEEF